MKKDPRHRAREAALQILYQWDVGRGDVDRAAETFFAFQWPNADPPSDELRVFAVAKIHRAAHREAPNHLLPWRMVKNGVGVGELDRALALIVIEDANGLAPSVAVIH